jgi:branched-chain amino acid transport system ATP-binding protein
VGDVLLEVSELTVQYGLQKAADAVSIHVLPGEAVFLVGPNGAGKTTLLRTISGLEKPVSGSIRLGGQEITQLRPWDIVRIGIAHVPQNRRCFGPLSVEDNLILGGYTQSKELSAGRLERVYEIFPDLRVKRRQKAAELSGGQQQMVAIGRALMLGAGLIMLDEPSLGLAPILVENLTGVLQEIRDQLGTAILIVEQNVNLALSVGTRGYVLQQGRVVDEGAPDDVRSELLSAYLGVDPTAQ